MNKLYKKAYDAVLQGKTVVMDVEVSVYWPFGMKVGNRYRVITLDSCDYSPYGSTGMFESCFWIQGLSLKQNFELMVGFDESILKPTKVLIF